MHCVCNCHQTAAVAGLRHCLALAVIIQTTTAAAAAAVRPAKYFSIDRVFRNEAVDRTHLAEFHQVEGLVCDRGLTLGHLIATLQVGAPYCT
jgi:phenylalanyl-tRNA synthetase alpha chain